MPRAPPPQQRINAFFAQAEKVEHIAPHTPIRFSQNGQIASTTLPLTVPGWDVTKDQGKQLIDAAQANDGNGLEIKLGGDPINARAVAVEPGGHRVPRRRDRAADRLRLGGGGRPAARRSPSSGSGISSAGLIPLLANVIDVPDWTTAVSGLIGIGVGIDYRCSS